MTDEKKHRLPPGKKLVFIQTQGAGSDMYDDIFPRYNRFFEQLGLFETSYLIHGGEINDIGAVKDRPDLLEKALETAKTIMNSSN